MDHVEIKVGLNHAGVKTGAEEVKHQLDGMKKHGESAAGHGGHGGGGHGGIHFFKEMKVEKNVAKLGQELANAQNGTQMLAIGLERVGKILHLGIGLGVVAHLAGYFIEAQEKIAEKFEKMKEEAEAFGETAHVALDSGNFDGQIAALEKGVKLMKDLKKAQAEGGTFKAFLGDMAGGTVALLSGGMFGGTNRAARNENRHAAAEVAELQEKVAEAAIEELQFTAEIADLKAEGHDREAAALENERKQKQEIARIERSSLSHEKKEEAIELVKAAHEAAGAAQDLADARELSAARQKEINDLDHKESELMGEMAHFGESDADRMERLVQQTGTLVRQNAFLAETKAKGRLSEASELQMMQQRVTVQKNLKDIAEIAHKEKEKRHSEAIREDIELATLAESNAEKLRKNALDGLTDEQKLTELMRERVRLAQQYRDALADRDPLTAEKIKGKVLDLNKEMDSLLLKPAQRPEIIGSHLARSGLGGVAFAAKEADPAVKAARTLEEANRIHKRAEETLKRIEDGLKNPRWKP